MRQSEAGKGSKQRPTDLNKYSNNWDSIFGKNKVVLGDGDYIPPITQEKIDELNKVLDQYETE